MIRSGSFGLYVTHSYHDQNLHVGPLPYFCGLKFCEPLEYCQSYSNKPGADRGRPREAYRTHPISSSSSSSLRQSLNWSSQVGTKCWNYNVVLGRWPYDFKVGTCSNNTLQWSNTGSCYVLVYLNFVECIQYFGSCFSLYRNIKFIFRALWFL